ncbi:MAG TPA: hypothetical protein VHU61_09760 [Solirubrobacteraceae bacterium]|nr:hypothetical protein [Solirubrobacteraceae bacterium]
MRSRTALALTTAFVCALVCAGLAGYGSAAALKVTPAGADALAAGGLPAPVIFDDGVIQNSPSYAPLDYGVAASGNEIAAVTGTGSATVFSAPAGGWSAGAPGQVAVTVPSSTVNSWTYGDTTYAALSPDGNTLYIEFTGEANNNETMLPPGHIYVYSHSGSSWSLSDTLSPAAGNAFASSGLTLSADGSTIVAGGIQSTQSSGEGSPGEPYAELLVFKQVSGSWSGVSTEATETPAFGSVDDAPWEWAVSADGATIAVETYDGAGAADEDDIVYTNDGTSQIRLAASGPAAISGDGATIVVSEPGGGGGAGFADVFERPGAAWVATGALAASARLSDADGGTFGQAVAVSSDGSAVYATVANHGNGIDTFAEPLAGWGTATAPTYSWTPTAYPSTATADSVQSLVLSPDDSTLVSLGFDCAGASSGNDDRCSNGMFVFGGAGGAGGGTATTTSTTTAASTTATTTASTPAPTQSSTTTTPQPSCPLAAAQGTNCSTGLGQPKSDGNALNMPASCDYVAADGVSCTYNSGAYQVSSAACQSGCSITPAQAESAASAAVQSFMSSIGQGPLGGNALARVPHLAALKKKGKPFRITHVGSGRVRIPAGKQRSLKLELNAAASRRLRRLHKLKLLVLVARTVAGHTTVVLKRDVTFRSPAKVKKRH